MALQKATLAAGCFWGVQYYFDQIPGVIKSTVGYTGGTTQNPTYAQVCGHKTGHAEAVELEYDPDLINFDSLLKHFFHMHDPTQLNRQGPDVGDQYRSAIFYHDEHQKMIAEIIIKHIQPQFKKPIVTTLEPAEIFYQAEDSHQKYAENTGHGMCHVEYKPLH